MSLTVKQLIENKKSIYRFFVIEESIKAVEQNGYALKYVNESVLLQKQK